MLFSTNFKKNSKGRCFIVEKFQIIDIGEAVRFISTFKMYFETWKFFYKFLDKICFKVGKIKKNFKSRILDVTVTVNTAFP